jgi:hypothetical protein
LGFVKWWERQRFSQDRIYDNSTGYIVLIEVITNDYLIDIMSAVC